jgi:hypothetical protein
MLAHASVSPRPRVRGHGTPSAPLCAHACPEKRTEGRPHACGRPSNFMGVATRKRPCRHRDSARRWRSHNPKPRQRLHCRYRPDRCRGLGHRTAPRYVLSAGCGAGERSTPHHVSESGWWRTRPSRRRPWFLCKPASPPPQTERLARWRLPYIVPGDRSQAPARWWSVRAALRQHTFLATHRIKTCRKRQPIGATAPPRGTYIPSTNPPARNHGSTG